jgi:hypothetical protein
MELNQEIIDKAKKLVNSAEFSKLILNTKINENQTSQKKETEELFKFYKDEEISFDERLCREFILFCLEHLKLNNPSKLVVVISADKEKFKTFAFYSMDTKVAAVYGVGRHILDVFRSLAHELVHFKQDFNNEISNEQVGDENDGVDIENEANSVAGVIMRKFGRLHPELY